MNKRFMDEPKQNNIKKECLDTEGKYILKRCLQYRGYDPTEEQVEELADIYEDCQEWEDGFMLTGHSYDEIEDFVMHSPCIDNVMQGKQYDIEELEI